MAHHPHHLQQHQHPHPWAPDSISISLILIRPPCSRAAAQRLSRFSLSVRAPPPPSSASEAAPRPSPARRVPSPSFRRMLSYTGMLALLLAMLPYVSSQNGKNALVWDLCVICFRGRCHLYDDRHPAALQSGWFVERKGWRGDLRATRVGTFAQNQGLFNSICLHEECFPSAHRILQSNSSCCLRSPFWHSHLRTCDGEISRLRRNLNIM